MTAQIPESLIYEGVERDMCSEPLNDYFRMGGKKPDLALQHTACWRSYEGTWEISDGKLYLIHLAGTTKAGDAVDLETLFPGYSKRVFADWYTGDVRIPQGKMLGYIHAGYASIFERDLFIEIDKGVVTNTYTRKNVAPKRRGNFSRLWNAIFVPY